MPAGIVNRRFMQRQRLVSEKAKKLLEKLNEIYRKVQELTEEKKRLIEEYQDRLKRIESEIVSLFIEAGRILDELETKHGLSLSQVQSFFKTIPPTFFKNAVRLYRKKPSSAAISTAVEKTYGELVEGDASTPAVLKTLRKISTVKPPPPPSRGREKFICPLCQEEHDKETEMVTIQICRSCHAFMETWLIPYKVFEGHGRPFVLKWQNAARSLERLKRVERAYRNLLRYLKSRGIPVPEELIVKAG